ncbi:MAG: T9SS type A sorting domain-containing protein [Deltaproteobacteria bacterium]|nr:T9SS type A sorting domain-containing protein [Deltaproteobacteria bacterium]
MKINQDLSIDSVSNIQLNYDSLCPYTIESGDRVCDCFTAFYVGIENDKVITLQDLEGIQAYPNPASEFITFETKTISRNRIIRIYDLNGKFVSEISFPQRSTEVLCNTSKLIAGTYIARLFIEERQTGSTKFIIQ